ncbi:MAG: Lrp/AsnC family transcriptional regulator [Desulfobacula sp.]|uniref:Lrp/AsnC family transcriptional regulator n=1 Tax=Desulfobacula sp. TaxID=2593537 RepID=UPI0025BA4F24|nr:Lrp/AsnC family transcriptional regulator [Desulfobacula sp.]MCD4718979.1 Lrp/AsnC family transcriptional regulator [Desulfobacula sp.]
MKKLDVLDKKLIHYLSEDGRMPVKELVNKLEITSPTLQVRMKNLLQSGVLKIVGLVDVFKIEKLFMALVAIRVIDDSKIDETLNDLSKMQEVHSVCAVTGRYDLFAEIIFSKDMEALYTFMSSKLPKQGNIASSESFVVMKSKKKWMLIPQDIDF